MKAICGLYSLRILIQNVLFVSAHRLLAITYVFMCWIMLHILKMFKIAVWINLLSSKLEVFSKEFSLPYEFCVAPAQKYLMFSFKKLYFYERIAPGHYIESKFNHDNALDTCNLNFKGHSCTLAPLIMWWHVLHCC